MKLQDAGLIRYRHGHIEVLDRPAAEQQVCECYAVVKREFDRLLPDLKVLDLLDSILASSPARWACCSPLPCAPGEPSQLTGRSTDL